MTEQELREKIVEVISQKQTYGITEEFKTEDLGHGGWQAWTETTKVNNAEIADALIAAGLCDKNTLDERYQTLMAAGFVQLASLRLDFEKVLHRAEVAERALDKAVELAYEYRTEADTLSCSSCPMGDELFPKCKDRGLYKECSKRWKEQLIEQAERELAEEKKDD